MDIVERNRISRFLIIFLGHMFIFFLHVSFAEGTPPRFFIIESSIFVSVLTQW